MIHYTCDLCGKSINAEKEDRFRVLIDVEQMHPGEDDSDLEREFAEDIGFDDMGLIPEETEESEGLFHSFKFDLCPACAGAYLNDPLGRKVSRRLRFMDN
jgi:hypothetical protein